MNMKIKQLCLLAIAFATYNSLTAQDNAKGYYKDLFIDGGIKLTSSSNLPSARYLGLSVEAFTSSSHKSNGKSAYNMIDTLRQHQVFGGSPIDENGVLLFPDGSPRFRMIYVNGGGAASHGRSLGEEGRARIREYIRNGGSYIGSCAGAFVASRAVKGDSALKYTDAYIGIWPGLTISTGIHNSQTRLNLDNDSPLLKYYDFGNRGYVDSVYHNGGGYGVTDTDWPKGTEILARYDIQGRTDLKLKRNIQDFPAIWGQKADEHSGRVIMCGSHPEFVRTGEKLELMCAMVRYALDGNGTPKLKGTLKNGEERKMYCFTHDNNPDFTAIGDKQYHHFALNVPKDTKKVTLTLKPKAGYANFDLFLLAHPQKYAYLGEAKYKNMGTGSEKTLVINQPNAGTLYLSVLCNTTVETINTPYGTEYTGRVDVLNGVPYSITATIE